MNYSFFLLQTSYGADDGGSIEYFTTHKKLDKFKCSKPIDSHSCTGNVFYSCCYLNTTRCFYNVYMQQCCQ